MASTIPTKDTNDIYEKYTVPLNLNLIKSFVVMEKLTESQIEEYIRIPIDSDSDYTESEYEPSVCEFLDNEAIEVDIVDSSDDYDSDMECDDWDLSDLESDPEPIVSSLLGHDTDSLSGYDSDSTSGYDSEDVPSLRVYRKSRPLPIGSDEED